MKRKWLTAGIMLLFIGTVIIPITAQVTERTFPISRENTLYVGGNGPENYTRIQDAINDSQDGDTVFVYDDSSPYYENLVVNQSIAMIGEGRNSTVVDGGREGNVALISADNVHINGFTMQHGGNWSGRCGVEVVASNGVTITNNNIVDNPDGISLTNSNNSTIAGNTFYQNQAVAFKMYFSNNNIFSNNWITQSGEASILIVQSTDNNISHNVIEYNENGILIWFSNNTVIHNNTIRYNNVTGIELYGGENNSILRNTIHSNDYFGMEITEVARNTIILHNLIDGSDSGLALGAVHSNSISISLNTFTNNWHGIDVGDSSLVNISRNNFVQNEHNAYFRIKPSEKNFWSKNFWDDHLGRGPKVIRGKLLLFTIELGYYWYFELCIPWINFDWHPASEPYGIGG
jgi:parallel beta-helix repeat protein